MFFMPAGRYACGGVSGVKPEGGGKALYSVPRRPRGVLYAGRTCIPEGSLRVCWGNSLRKPGRAAKPAGCGRGCRGILFFQGRKIPGKGTAIRAFCGSFAAEGNVSRMVVETAESVII